MTSQQTHNQNHDVVPEGELPDTLPSSDGLQQEDSIGKRKQLSAEQGGDTWAWIVLISAFVVNALNAGLNASWGTMYPFLQDRMQVSLTTVSWVGSIYSGMHVIGGSLGPPLVQRVGCRTTGLVAVTMMTGGILASMFVSNVYMLYFTASILTGIGHSFNVLVFTTAVATYFDKKRPLAFGIVTTGGGLGVVAIPLLVTYLATSYTLWGAFLILAGILFNEYCAVLTFTPLKGQSRTESQAPVTLVRRLQECVLLLMSPKAILLCMSSLLQGLVFQAFFSFMPSVALMLIQGLTPEQAAVTVSVMGVVSICGRLICGVVSNAAPRLTLNFYIVSLLGCGIVTTLITLTTGYTVLLVVCGIFGLFQGAMLTLQPNVAHHLYDDKDFTTAYGLIILCNGLASAVGSPLASLLADRFGNVMVIYYFSAVGFVVSGLILLPLTFSNCNALVQQSSDRKMDDLKD